MGKLKTKLLEEPVMQIAGITFFKIICRALWLMSTWWHCAYRFLITAKMCPSHECVAVPVRSGFYVITLGLVRGWSG